MKDIHKPEDDGTILSDTMKVEQSEEMRKQKKCQRVTVEQYVQITDWFRMNKDKIRIQQYTQLEAALQAENDLGYSVPLTTIQRCAKIAKIRWAKSPPKPPPVPIEREAIIILIGALAGLYVETGRTIPTGLANLKSTYVREPTDEENQPNE